MRLRRSIRDISIATRLSLVALVVMLVSLAIAAGVGLQRGSSLAENSTEDRLVTVAATRGSSIEALLQSARREVATMGISPGTAAAIESFSAAYREFATDPPTAAERRTLQEFYLSGVAPELERVRGMPVSVSRLVPRLPAALRVQERYTVPREPTEDGATVEPALVVDAGDGSNYSSVHAELHPVYAEIAARSDFDDVYLIDARDNTVVYSARKRIDFGTSLDVGPLSGSALSALIEQVAEDPDPAAASVADFAAYPPAFDAPRMFYASQVLRDDGSVVGYVAASMSPQPFDEVMSGSGEWNALGDSGDAVIVGGDGTLRTTTRVFREAAREVLAVPDDPGPADLTDAQRRRIRETGTTALVQPVDQDVLAGAEEPDEVIRTQTARGVEVVLAVRPIDVEELGWTVVTVVDAEELDQPIIDYARNMLIAVALFVVAVTFAAVRWSDRVVAPIRAIGARLRAVRQGQRDTDDAHRIPAGSPEEYEVLSTSIDEMLVQLRDRKAAADARVAERHELVAGFLPPAVAQRARLGDDVLDQVPSASVAVLSIGGVGGLVERMSEHDVRERLAEIVDQLDELAAEFGLDRVKVTGATYFAVCGVSRPYLDHIPRSVSFALAAADVVGDVASTHGVDLELRSGVDSGPVSVGLAGRTGLVYDAWGPAVNGASILARRAPAGGVVVSTRVRDHLPAEFVIERTDDEASDVVTGRLSEAAT